MPVVRDKQGLRKGVETVIDKDLTTAHMAIVLEIEEMIILTAVSKVAVHLGKLEQKGLD